jgi:hypothetical protein
VLRAVLIESVGSNGGGPAVGALGPKTSMPRTSSGQLFERKTSAIRRTSSGSLSGSALPSTTMSMDGSVLVPMPMTHRSFSARLRAFRVPSPAMK